MATKQKQHGTLDKLCIFGDSWGCGAWSTSDGTFLWDTNGDDYFTESFKKYYNYVENYSAGGISNVDIIKKIKQVLENSAAIPTLLVIQTDPIRDILPFLSKGDVDTGEYQYILKTDYQSFNNMLLEFYYLNLNSIAKTFDIMINLVGGCSDIDVSISKNYKNLNVVCDSFYKLLDPTHKLNSLSNTHDILNGVKSFSTNNLKLLNSLVMKNKIQKQYQETYFGYDNDNHPSRKGIDLWTSHIYKTLSKEDGGTL